VIVTSQLGGGDRGASTDPDELLSLRLRDLALVDLDALCAGLDDPQSAQLVGAYADDVVDALRDARARLAALRQALAGPDPLMVLDATPRQRASDAGVVGAARVRDRLVSQAEAARALGRLAELAAGLVPRLSEAERRR
jgi:hypothetical protein